MARHGAGRVTRWSTALTLLVAALLALGACHPQEPPGKRDATAETPRKPPQSPPLERY